VTVTEVPACDGTVSAQTAWEEACFEPSTGYLLRQRTLGSSAAVKTRLATDVVRVFERDASGNTRFEGWYGGDDAPGLSTGEDLCSLTLPAQADYRMRCATGSPTARSTSRPACPPPCGRPPRSPIPGSRASSPTTPWGG